MTNSQPGIRSYLTAAKENEAEGLEEHPIFLAALEELDGLYRKLVTGKGYCEHPVCGLLAMQSHSMFLAAAGSAFRGQVPPTFLIIRACIESALYAYLVSQDKANGDLWLNRDQNLKAMKEKFHANGAIKILETRDKNLADSARETYQWTIELGAHPNPDSITRHIRFLKEEEDSYPISLIYLNGTNSGACAAALLGCVENACLAIAVICHSIPDHPEAGEVFARVWPLRDEILSKLRAQGYVLGKN